jgi:GH15 family glucan-1,4-alpha-glucosidase
MELVCDPRPGYGEHGPVTWLRRLGWLVAELPDGDTLVADGLEGPFERRTVAAGDAHGFSLTLNRPGPSDLSHSLERTAAHWREWCAGLHLPVARAHIVERSALTLKGLQYQPSGAIIAAATTSLPECIGGTRNWDYRYSWLRDATLTLSALGKVGKVDEAQSWLDWLKMISLASGVEDLQIMYGVGGEPDLPEAELGHLEGYRASAPVRTGNGAATQRQIDTYGEVADALWTMRLRSDEPMNPHRWRLMRALANRTLREWREPDEGIWEVRGEPAHFVLSKVMCWVALDRAIALADLDGYEDENLPRWRRERDELRQEILERGFDHELGSFTQSYGSGTLDASNLMLATVGFIAPDDARFVGTVRATQEHLMRGGLVDRYDVGHTDDGFAGQEEGTFAICTLWLCNALLQIGDVHAARELFDRVAGCANDLGLLAEELTPDGEQLGNYPQAYTHIALILCAFALQDAEVTHLTH